jgi:hypothetical protein
MRIAHCLGRKACAGRPASQRQALVLGRRAFGRPEVRCSHGHCGGDRELLVSVTGCLCCRVGCSR